MIDLNLLIPPDSGWILQSAAGINDAGQIVGNGLFGSEQTAFLLTPVSTPEPATFGLCGVALGGFVILRLLRRDVIAKAGDYLLCRVRLSRPPAGPCSGPTPSLSGPQRLA